MDRLPQRRVPQAKDLTWRKPPRGGYNARIVSKAPVPNKITEIVKQEQRLLECVLGGNAGRETKAMKW